MYHVFRNEKIWVACVVSSFLLLSLVEPIVGLTHVPEKTVYTYLHNHPEDYFYYLHIMRQGYDGAWLATTRMTPEVFPSQFAIPFFILLGKVGRVIPLGMGELYTMARVVGAIALMLVIYRVIASVFADKVRRIAAFVITLSGAYWPMMIGGKIAVSPLVGLQWTELDPVMRLTFVPHHLWSKVLFVLILLVFARQRALGTNPTVRRTLPWAVLIATIVMGFTSPVILITFTGVVTLWTGVEWVGGLLTNRRPASNFFILYLVAVSAAGIVSWYHWKLAHSVFPWTTYGPPWENNWYYLVSVGSYGQSFGLLLPLAFLGAAIGWRKDSLVRMLALWVVAGWLFIFVLRPFLPFSNSRYLAGYQWIAVGILAALGLSKLGELLSKRHALRGFLVLVTIAVVAAAPSWYASLRFRVGKIYAARFDPEVFTRQEIRETLSYLGSLKEGSCVVAAPDWLSTMIPAYTSCRSISGHRLMTYANDIKVYEMNEFFYWPVPLEKKAARLRQYGVTHVVTLEGITGSDILALLSPSPVFSSGGLKVYTPR